VRGEEENEARLQSWLGRIQPLLEQQKIAITPTGTSFATLAEFTAYAHNHGVILTPGTPAER
jgi:hypothetical protein